MDNTKKTVLEALEIAKGIVTDACKATDTPRSTFYKWVNTDPEFKEQVDEIQEVAIDYVEGKLFEKIAGVTVKGKGGKEGDDEPPTYELPPSDTAIIFYLKTKAKRRGYVERVESTGANGTPIQTESKHVVEFRNYGQGDSPAV